jgi:hypothetical protein
MVVELHVTLVIERVGCDFGYPQGTLQDLLFALLTPSLGVMTFNKYT